MYQSSSLYGFSFYIDYHHYQFYDQVWSWGFCAVEQLTSSLQISERKLDWQVDLTKPTPLQIKLQPMSFNLKSRFGHRRVAVDLIVEVGGGNLIGCWLQSSKSLRPAIAMRSTLPDCARYMLTLQEGSFAPFTGLLFNPNQKKAWLGNWFKQRWHDHVTVCTELHSTCST